MNKLLEVKNINIKYKDKEILNGLTFDVLSGETVSLIWKNWTWKSSLLKAILWEVKYSWEIKKHTNKISYVPQKLDFDKTIPITSFEFIKLYNKKAKKEKILSLLKEFNSENLLDKNLWNLSGWELQKVLIINSILKEPELLLLDEPTAGIDRVWEEEFYALISKIKEVYPKMWVVLVSHNLNIIYKNSDKIVHLHEKCFCVWTPEEISKDTEFSGKDFKPFIHKHSHNHSE